MGMWSILSLLLIILLVRTKVLDNLGYVYHHLSSKTNHLRAFLRHGIIIHRYDELVPIMTSKRMCTAKRTNGEVCHLAPIKGGFVCRVHGGSSPQVKAKAHERLLEMVEPALIQLNRILTKAVDSKSPDDTKLNAIKEILNRVGVSGIDKLEISGPEGAPLEVSLAVSKEEKIRRITGLLDRVSEDDE